MYFLKCFMNFIKNSPYVTSIHVYHGGHLLSIYYLAMANVNLPIIVN